jgi:hypothetical protein
VSTTRSKTSYLTQVRFERFLGVWLPNVFLLTLTFKENIEDKAEAERRWKPIADYLKRHKVEWCGVWQQQKRGAWHHHVLINRYLDINTLRPFAVARGWGTFINIERVGKGSHRFPEVAKLVRYLTRYLTRDLCGHVPARIRLTSGSNVNKVGTVRFMWVEGMARVWRVGVQGFVDVYGLLPRRFTEIREAWTIGFHLTGLLTFEPVTLDTVNPYG